MCQNKWLSLPFPFFMRFVAVLRARDSVQRCSMKNRFLKLDILIDLCAIDIQSCYVTIIDSIICSVTTCLFLYTRQYNVMMSNSYFCKPFVC